jgi:hypothetical protein
MALKQNTVPSALVAAALAFKPFQHVGITPHGKLLWDGQVLLAALCTLPVFALCGRQFRKVHLAFGLGRCASGGLLGGALVIHSLQCIGE